MNTYEDYLKSEAKNVLPMEEALQIYTDMLGCLDRCKAEDKQEFIDIFVKSAVEYAHIRGLWEVYDNEKRMSEDSYRTSKHDAMIVNLNVLARLCNVEGIETPWREQLGEARKRIGDFACFVSYIAGINNR